MGLYGHTGIDPSGTALYTQPGPGNPMCPILNAVAGEHFYLVINNATFSNTGFKIDFLGTATLACNEPSSVLETNTSNIYSIYPNPVDKYFYLKNNDFNPINIQQLKIRSLDGKCLLQIQSNQERFEIGGISNGLYIVEIVDNEKVYYEKIMVQNGSK